MVLILFAGIPATTVLAGDVFCNDRTGTDNGIISDSDSRNDRYPRTDPDITADYDRCRIEGLPLLRRHAVIERCERHVVAD